MFFFSCSLFFSLLFIPFFLLYIFASYLSYPLPFPILYLSACFSFCLISPCTYSPSPMLISNPVPPSLTLFQLPLFGHLPLLVHLFLLHFWLSLMFALPFFHPSAPGQFFFFSLSPLLLSSPISTCPFSSPLSYFISLSFPSLRPLTSPFLHPIPFPLAPLYPVPLFLPSLLFLLAFSPVAYPSW